MVGNGKSARGRVIVVSPSAFPLGGVATWLDYLIPGLIRDGWDARLALTAGGFHDVDEYCRAHSIENVIPVSTPTGTLRGRVRALSRLLVSQVPDVVLGVNIVDLYAAVENLRQNG